MSRLRAHELAVCTLLRMVRYLALADVRPHLSALAYHTPLTILVRLAGINLQRWDSGGILDSRCWGDLCPDIAQAPVRPQGSGGFLVPESRSRWPTI
jgi:hypothetical protein